jgi:Tol biopolymer transport system component/DNA-binding winged helix-turn-helix (wHTH) protein
MLVKTQAFGILHFGAFELDLRSGELRNKGIRIKLQEQPFQVLIVLVQRAGELVSRDELRSAIWPADTFVDFDNSLNTAVNKLREALSDSPNSPRFIETVPRRGYRFVAPVSNQQKIPTNRLWRRRLWVILGLLLLTGVIWTLRHRFISPPEPFRRVDITQVTRSGRVTTAALSPDARYVVYAKTETGTSGPRSPAMQSLWVKQVAGGEVQIVAPSAASYSGVAFSPDGSNLYLLRAEEIDSNVGILYKMPTLGGTLRRIANHVDSPVTLSPDGKQLAFIRNSGEKRNSVLIVANEDGTGERQLAERKDPDGFEVIAWSPVETAIAAVVYKSDTSGIVYRKLIEVRLQDGRERALSSERWSGVWALTWVLRGKGLVLDAQYQPGGPVHIIYVSRDSGEVRKITNDPKGAYLGLTASADSTTLAALQANDSVDLWVGRFSDANSFQPVTTGSRSAWGAWTPDKRIVFANYGEGNSIWAIKRDGGGATQLTAATEYNLSYLRVSPNGRYVVFTSWKTGSPHVWRMDVDGSNLRQLTNSQYDLNFNFPDYSPDGVWVIYAKNGPEKGIWKVSIEGGDPMRLTDVNARLPVVSPDGNMIAYQDTSEGHPHRVAIMPFAGGAAVKTFDIPSADTLRWTPDSHEILYSETDGDVSNIWSQPISGGKPKQITRFNSDQIWDFDLSRDGSQIVLSRGRIDWDVMLVREIR